ncbi:MAG TPA: YbiU family protein, partial [Dongiaceae bacterium]
MTDLAALKDNKDALARVVSETKAKLRALNPDHKTAFRKLEEEMRREAEAVAGKRARGEPVIPEIEFQDVISDRVPGAAVAAIRRTGCAVIHNVFPRAQAEAWNGQLGDYITDNGYYERKVDPNLDKYFSTLKSDRPQIFGIYWSKPQIEARQASSMAATRAFLNSLWRHDSEGSSWFDPRRETTYADRTRRRQPGDVSLGLSPHMDAGSVERWIDDAYQRVYRHVFSGDVARYDPFDGAWRTHTQEIPSPAVCSVFRTYQGWTALTPQGPGDGTLQLIPIARGIAYMLLRALQEDVPEDELCGAQPARALSDVGLASGADAGA